ncbi:MAG: hypothetical protein N2049_04670 [Anaerolineales bacterium]|nr:hypothetical protein [Anaerolineales bacterium]MCX7608497.1 hypothetical protein [Anaerolineales bacterium]MDW8227173.1 hypothetical protein [Anaerolineales bacterium]
MYLILFVLNNPDRLEDVLVAWEQAGVSGITILPSTGLGRIRQKEGLRDDLPLIPSLADFYHHEADVNHTLFTLVENEDLARRVLEATEATIGRLDQPGKGILAILPTVQVHGIIARNPERKAG